MKIVCAWCGKDIGEKKPLADKSVTHGICEECLIKNFPRVAERIAQVEAEEGNPEMAPDERLLKVAIEREPLKVASQLGYEVHRLSPTDIVDKADYASGYRFRLSKAVPNQPYPQIVMARSEGEVATFLKRQTEGGNPDAKEPWQMTRDEFSKIYPFKAGADAVHRSAVFGAVNQGKPVPPEVLADYPDLAAREEGNPDPMMVIHKPNVDIHFGTVGETYKTHIYRLGDKLVARRGGILRVVQDVPLQRLDGYGMYYGWEETDEIVEENPHYVVCQTIELCHPIEASSKEQAIGLARDKGETDARTNLLKDWHVKRKEGNPMTPEEIDQVATKVAAKVLEETAPSVLDPAGRGLLLHFTEHEIEGAGLVVNEAKARASPCNCFTYKDREYCFSPGVIGMMSSRENPEQIDAYCAVGKSYEVKPGIKERFESFAGAAEAAHKKIEGIPKGEKLVPWLGAMSDELGKRAIEV